LGILRFSFKDEDEDELLCDMTKVLSDISLQELEAVFEEWLIRFD
jgi:hypothetical protein